tara:strand:+ start:4905 stop:6011 length:1107 start_codon:yes stop_codon:yes gene_type:complete
MEGYDQFINEVELALNNGDYKLCISKINPILENYPVSTPEGVNIRMMLLTALSGINKNADAVIICKQLLKAKTPQVREEAKALLQILNSPDLKIPENWNIKFDNNFTFENYKDSPKTIKNSNQQKKYINISKKPTGETKPFNNGFIVFTLILLILLFNLLSGCVKITNTLDLKDLDSINYGLEIETKYRSKIPWQINFENKLKKFNNLNKTIKIDDEKFLFSTKGLSLEKVNLLINQVLDLGSDTIERNLNSIEIDYYSKNFFLGERYYFDISLNLSNLEKIDDLDLLIKIINPSKAILYSEDSKSRINNNEILWFLSPGEINRIKFSFWNWNKFLIGTFFVIIFIAIAYFIRNKKYELGSDLPQLPS